MAEPVLASALIGDAELECIVDGVFDQTAGTRGRPEKEKEKEKERGGERVGVGVKSVDGAVAGGLRMGSVVAVSGEGGAGGQLGLAYLASTLLSVPKCTAAVIDTTGNVDVLRIYTILVSRLKRDSELFRRQQGIYSGSEKEEGKERRLSEEELAATFLDRVKIMRVFDLVGVMEAVGEVRDGLEGRGKVEATREEDKKMGEGEKKKEDDADKDEKQEGASKKEKARKTVIADSEDEDDDEDEMLFEVTDEAQQERPHQVPEPESQIDRPQPVSKPHAVKDDRRNDDASTNAKVSFILLDNLAHVLSPILKKDFVKGNVLASAFLRSLSNLTHHHSLLTILQNPASLPRELTPSRSANANSDNLFQAPPQQQHRREAAPHPSIFTSNKLIPALGNIMAPWLDTHLMVSNIPRRKADARALAKYNDGRTNSVAPGPRGVRGVEMVNVVEVLTDRRKGRTGDWGTFVEGDDGGLIDA
ncbi:hypothetical protein K491DRAFT_715616 [Lophiostoma macrostomum CBS 122681]|uniref:DNA recombination and repair protein Rad51-like C-terminal domain-containing protein n=1 Tax=Lophiostoma macrostomum CBS 122681 TaxID=1314788 RepID=A0A6A6T8R2_9PLEO|nr:hypothetical protein K491DRAFT_715616 [Lophiostoma macrostomum CBS 122681]